MKRIVGWVMAGGLVFSSAVQAEDSLEETEGWQRVDSRYCTIWLHPALTARWVNQRVSTWRIRPQSKLPKGASFEEQLAAKCDTILLRAQELLDMYPLGLHVTVRLAEDVRQVQDAHAARYGFDTEAIAFYVFENNTIYAAAPEVSESVLAHEMAHCIVDHYFGIRPPRKIEEMLAMYVDEHLQD